MFSFGDPVAIGRLYIDSASVSGGTNLPAEEMSAEELKIYLTDLRVAFYNSRMDYGTEQVQVYLLSEFDKTFKYLCKKSKWFRDLVIANRHSYIQGQTAKQKAKYKGIAHRASSRKIRRNPNPDQVSWDD